MVATAAATLAILAVWAAGQAACDRAGGAHAVASGGAGGAGGGFFDHHDKDGTPGTLIWSAEATAVDHPIVRGITTPWSCVDEWYALNRDVAAVPGFVILGRLSSDQRPAVWIHELAGGGRAFYTIRGHNQTVFAEPSFIQLLHQGILWAVHRMK